MDILERGKKERKKCIAIICKLYVGQSIHRDIKSDQIILMHKKLVDCSLYLCYIHISPHRK